MFAVRCRSVSVVKVLLQGGAKPGLADRFGMTPLGLAVILTDPAAVERYVTQASTSLRPGGHLMLSTFAPDGPERCSGLTVQRYSAQTLLERFAPHFCKRATERELHLTPWGAVQPFTCVWLERRE